MRNRAIAVDRGFISASGGCGQASPGAKRDRSIPRRDRQNRASPVKNIWAKKGDIFQKPEKMGFHNFKLRLRFQRKPEKASEIMPMNSNQIVSNSLAEALQDFQLALAPLLKLGKISEWNGTILKQREEKIRELALILGGKCIAILLEKLASCKEACSRALTETQGWWRTKTRKHGSKEQKILTIGNVIINLKLPYVVERKTRSSSKKKPAGQGFCPFLRWLGMEKKVTPLVWATCAENGIMRSSFATAKLTLKDWGINLSIRKIQGLTYSFCQEALSQRNSKIRQQKRGKLASTQILQGKRVVISVDGGRTRLINYEGRKRQKKTNRRGYQGEWKEPKLLTIYAVDEKGKKIKNGEIPITNDGTFGNSKELLALLEMYLVHLGIKSAQSVLFIADGADWMWKDIPALLKRLGCELKTTYYRVNEKRCGKRDNC